MVLPLSMLSRTSMGFVSTLNTSIFNIMLWSVIVQNQHLRQRGQETGFFTSLDIFGHGF